MTVIVDGTNGLTFPDVSVQATSATNATNISSGTLPFARLPAGSILQVVNATYSTDTSTSSSTYSDTGITASITPKFSTSKILVIVSVNGQEKINNTFTSFQLLRGASAIAFMEYEAGYTGTSTTNAIGSSSINYLDSPATTSSTTYKVQFKSGANIASVKICSSSSVSTITLMEIAG